MAQVSGMELYCSEVLTFPEETVASEDPTLTRDARVLDNMMQLQLFNVPPQDYFKHIQSDIQPHMRKVVTRWMLEVSVIRV